MEGYRRKARVLPASELYSAKQKSFNTQKLTIAWKIFYLACSVIACMVTPIIICIIQDAMLFTNTAVILGIVCDCVFAIAFVQKIINFVHIHQPFVDPSLTFYDAIESLMLCSSLFLVPIVSRFVATAPYLAWAVLPRLLALRTLVSQFKSLQCILPETSSLRSDTVARVVGAEEGGSSLPARQLCGRREAREALARVEWASGVTLNGLYVKKLNREEKCAKGEVQGKV